MIFGDFNVYLLYGYGDKNLVNLNECGRVLEQFLDECRLMLVLSQMDIIGLDYFYVGYSGEQIFLIDYVVILEDKFDFVKEIGIFKDYYFNCFDYFLIFLNILLEEVFNIKLEMNDKEMGVNWCKVFDDDVCIYRQLVCDFMDNIVFNGIIVVDIEEYIIKLFYFLVYVVEFVLLRKCF